MIIGYARTLTVLDHNRGFEAQLTEQGIECEKKSFGYRLPQFPFLSSLKRA